MQNSSVAKGLIKKSALWFLFFLTIFYFIFQAFFAVLAKNQEKIDQTQTSIIQENVKDRFTLFLRVPLNIAIIGADYFASGDLLKKDYGPFADELLTINKEILGLSVVDVKGKIIRIFPEAKNPNALGRISQNIKFLDESLEKKEKFWLSSPFKLFQGCDGFALYMPIVESKTHKGWFAPIICTENFLESFKNAKFFESYELIIKDKASNLPYFSTALMPNSEAKIYESTYHFFGRDLIFQSWRKDEGIIYDFPKYWSLIASLIISILFYYLFHFYQLKIKAREQLKEISVLLRFTSKEAITNLIEAQTELSSHQSKEEITYLSNLIEQIDLLQTMAHTGEGLQDDDLELLPLIQGPMQNLEDVIWKKNLTINLKHDEFKDVRISINGWLIQNSVVSSILSHSIIYAERGSNIEISHSESSGKHFIVFHILKVHTDPSRKAFLMDRRLEVAKKVLNVHQGELFVQNDLHEGMLIRVIIPVKKNIKDSDLHSESY